MRIPWGMPDPCAGQSSGPLEDARHCGGFPELFERASIPVTKAKAEAKPSLVLGQSQQAATYWDSEFWPQMQMPHNPNSELQSAFGQVAIIDALTERGEDHQGRASFEFRAGQPSFEQCMTCLSPSGIWSCPTKLGGADPVLRSLALCRS